jgi:hypothetical protein
MSKKGWLAAIFRTPDAAVESTAAAPKGGIPTSRAPSKNASAATTTRPIVASPPKMTVSVAPPPLRTTAPPAPGPRSEPVGDRPRLTMGVDGTGSRAAALKATQHMVDTLCATLPGELDVNLAVHGGGRLHTWTRFVPDPDFLRPIVARVRCEVGYTRLCDILERVLKSERVRVLIYIGDVFEEDRSRAVRLAKALLLNETRVIILHDGIGDEPAGEVFQTIAAITGGAVLPFSLSSLDQLGETLQAVSVLAVGGTELLETKQETMPAAPLLLKRLADTNKQQLLIGGNKGGAR